MPRGRDRARARGPPAVIAADRPRRGGRRPRAREIILQTPASFGESDEEALESSREWKGTLVGEMGATAVVVMNVSGADPLGLIRACGERVLPGLRD